MTTSEHQGPAHHHGHSHHHGTHDHDVDWAELAASSELEAEVLHQLLDQATARIAGQVPAGSDVHRIIDIGPGPGVGTAALAGAFPDAEVIAVDGSDVMLAKVDARAARLGLADRVRTVHADLPDGLDGLGPADVVWASMVMHHLGNERAALAAIHAVLAPGGVLAINEFGDPPRYLPDDTDIDPPGLQDRISAAGAAWVARIREELPDSVDSADYPTMLREAGFELVTDVLVTTRLDAPLGTDARTVVTNQLRRRHDSDGSALDPADLAALDALLDADNPNGIMQRPDVFLAASRHLYIARTTNPGGGTNA